jgi:hypothetical protein
MLDDRDSAGLSRSAASLGTLYIDKHVRLDHGQLTELPRRTRKPILDARASRIGRR